MTAQKLLLKSPSNLVHRHIYIKKLRANVKFSNKSTDARHT